MPVPPTADGGGPPALGSESLPGPAGGLGRALRVGPRSADAAQAPARPGSKLANETQAVISFEAAHTRDSLISNGSTNDAK